MPKAFFCMQKLYNLLCLVIYMIQFARGSGGSTSGSDHISTRPGILDSFLSNHSLYDYDQEDERRYVTYYQWVGFTLFFQVIDRDQVRLRKASLCQN